MRRVAVLTILVLASASLWACSSKQTASPTPSASGTSSATPSTPTTSTATAMLDHEPTGTVTMSWSSSTKKLTVGISMIGLGPDSTHPAHIHSGTCANTGNIIYPLDPVTATATGDATVTTTVSNVGAGIPASGWSLNVHTGPALTPADQYRPIACIDISNPSHAAAFTGAFKPVPGTGNDVTGTAVVSLDPTAHSLGVSVTVHGLDPNTAHAAHVHEGSCEAQGPVVYSLPNVKSDATGTGSVTATFSGVTATAIPSTWYVNVHNTTDVSTQVGFTPLSCGNLVRGQSAMP
jgi:hypothetical protein